MCINLSKGQREGMSEEDLQKKGYFRCKPCGRFNNFCTSHKNADDVNAFKTWSSDDKRAFLVKFGDELPTDVASFLHTSVVEKDEEADEDEWGVNGDHVDEIELERRYKDHPLVKQNIVNNARSFKCEVTGLIIYIVPKYFQKSTHKESHTTTRKREAAADQNLKKKLKVAKEPVEKAADSKGLSESQKTKAEKMRDKVIATIEDRDRTSVCVQS